MSKLFIDLSTVVRAFAIMAALVVVGASPVVGVASKGNLDGLKLDRDRTLPPLNITLGKADLVDVDGEISDILVADPDVVDVMAVQSNRLYVVGVSIGDTNLIALDSNGVSHGARGRVYV